jgi:type I restriction enzyme S subunit
MGSELKSVGDLAASGIISLSTGPFGSALHKHDYRESGRAVVPAEAISDGDLDSSKLNYIDEAKAEELTRYFLEPGDLVFARRGAQACGHSAYVTQENNGAVAGTGLLFARILKEDVLDPLYFFLVMSSSESVRWLKSHAIGATMPNLNTGIISSTPFRLIPLDQQREIISNYVPLRSKLSLLAQMNATLEGMAQALFKSWFVDFDPVIDNALAAGNPIPDELAARARLRQGFAGQAEVRKKALASSGELGRTNGTTQQGSLDHPTLSDPHSLFPDSFQFNAELGWIPEGWDVNTIEEIADKVAMGPFGSSIKVSTFVESGIPVISGQHLKETTLDDNTYRFVTEEHAEKLKRSNVYRGDIIFTHAGNIGQVSLIPEDSQYKRYVISQRQFYLRCDLSKASPLHLTYFFRSNEGQHVLLANASQVGVPSISRPSSYLRTIPFLNPPESIREHFDQFANNSLQKTTANKAQVKELTKLRDTLLPKLISGELHLPNQGQLRA